MNEIEEARARRNYVSKMYPGLAWQEKVAHMPSDQVTAIYLRFIRDNQKPKPETPEKLERAIQSDPNFEQFKMF